MEPIPQASPEADLEALYTQISRMARDLPGPLRRIQVHIGSTAVEVEWQESHRAEGPPVTEVLAGALPAQSDGAVAPAAAESQSTVPVAGEALLASPMVGTFYRAASPSEPPFVEVGDMVEEGRTVGVIEAMKLFNPITAEMSGVVVEILVGDVEPVEFGQPLIRLAAVAGLPAGAEAG